MSGTRSTDTEKLERDARTNANDFLSSPPLSDLRTKLDATDERDYAAVVDSDTLCPVDNTSRGALIAVAAWVGNTRLIDNLLIAQH